MEDIYRTNSLPLASYLCSCKEDVEFVGVDKSNPETISFKFAPSSKALSLAEDYFSGKSTANALELFKNYRVLKDLIFETKRNSVNHYDQ